MSVNIQLAHQLFELDVPGVTRCSRCIPVIRLDALRRWLENIDIPDPWEDPHVFRDRLLAELDATAPNPTEKY